MPCPNKLSTARSTPMYNSTDGTTWGHLFADQHTSIHAYISPSLINCLRLAWRCLHRLHRLLRFICPFTVVGWRRGQTKRHTEPDDDDDDDTISWQQDASFEQLFLFHSSGHFDSSSESHFCHFTAAHFFIWMFWLVCNRTLSLPTVDFAAMNFRWKAFCYK